MPAVADITVGGVALLSTIGTTAAAMLRRRGGMKVGGAVCC